MARVECTGNFAYKLDIALEDNSEAYFDKVDDLFFSTKYRSIKVKDAKEEKFSAVIDFELDSYYVETELEDINDGNGLTFLKVLEIISIQLCPITF